MTILIDSWAWIEYFRGTKAGEKIKQIIENKEEFIISTINAAEVYRCLLSDLGEAKASSAINFMLSICFVIPVDLSIAISAAKLKHEKKIGLGDALVMATANSHGASVLTGDPDFKNEKNVIYLERL